MATVPPSVRDVLHALSDDTRLEMVRRLARAGEDVPCAALYDEDVPKSTASYHFTLLRESGVISQHDSGSRRLNRLERDAVESSAPGVLEAVLGAFERERAS